MKFIEVTSVYFEKKNFRKIKKTKRKYINEEAISMISPFQDGSIVYGKNFIIETEETPKKILDLIEL